MTKGDDDELRCSSSEEYPLPKRLTEPVPESSPVGSAAGGVLRYLRRMGDRALGLLVFALLATVGLMWAAALIGIQPSASWLQTGVGSLLLFMMVYALILILGCLIYGFYYALRHIRAWPQAARSAIGLLTGSSDSAIFVRQAILPLAATVFLFLAARRYYVCHFADGCSSKEMMACHHGSRDARPGGLS
jgi:hypothetical protein